jgi:hypothetical protein
MILHLPPGTTTQTPTGTSVQRDYATFASQYSAKGSTITASRHINFLWREVSADRAADYNAFLRAVRNDEAQDFTLDRAPAPISKPAAHAAPPPSTPETLNRCTVEAATSGRALVQPEHFPIDSWLPCAILSLVDIYAVPSRNNFSIPQAPRTVFKLNSFLLIGLRIAPGNFAG